MGKRKRCIDRKIIALTAFFLTVAGSLTPEISAYFAAADQEENEASVGGVNIEIEEEFTPPPEIHPGTVIPKNVNVKNLGPNDCYVRVTAVFSDSHMGQYCETDWNTEDWEKQADGYYYYKKPLLAGESTTSLFTQITVKKETPEVQMGDLDVIVYGEGYQSKGYGTWQEAWEAYRANKPPAALGSERHILTEQELGVYGEVDGAEESEMFCVDEASIMPCSAEGSYATISKVRKIYYASYYTNVFQVQTETGTWTGYCAEPDRTAVPGVYTVSILQNDAIKRLLLSGPDGPYYDQVKNGLFAGLSWDTAFADTHASIGYLYCGDTTGMSDWYLDGIYNQINCVTKGWVGDILDDVVDRYNVYIAYNSAGQDIVWLEHITRKGAVRLTKTDESGTFALSGAEYTLYTGDGARIGTYVTDQAGSVYVGDLEFGNYYFKETKPPAGYRLSNEAVRFSVNGGNAGTVQEIHVTDPMETRSLTLIKRIAAADINFANGTPSFLFHVSGTDVKGKAHEYYQAVTFDAALVSANTGSDGYVSLRVVFPPMEPGTYRAGEVEVGRYVLEYISDVSKNGSICQEGDTEAVIFNLIDFDSGCAVFTNRKYENQNYSDCQCVINVLKKEP